MTLSRWRRVATGVAAGVIVMCAALIGASFRDDTAGVSVASELRPANIIPIEEDPVDTDTGDTDTGDTSDDESEPVQVIDADDLPDTTTSDTDATNGSTGDTTDDGALDTADDTSDADTTSDPADSGTNETEASDPADSDAGDTDASETDVSDTDASVDEAPAPAATAEPAAPLTASDDALGTGGGVDDAECALDRLVIYAGARVGGVAGSIRAALAQAGFAAGCPAPVTVLASNCPLQFAGVLGAGSGYNPATSFVASSASVDRETMTAVMGTVGYSGNEINILDFSFVNPDKPGEQWMAIFIPPSFAGWENLASRAGLSPSTTSLCAASGQLAG